MIVAFVFVIGITGFHPQPSPSPMALVPGGKWTLPFRKDSVDILIKVEPFSMDLHAVTAAEYAAFVKQQQRFRRSRIKALFADNEYLKDWIDDSTPPPAVLSSPVTQISWYMAKEYCACQDKRLPTTAEWEWAAWSLPLGTDVEAYRQRILDWYSQPANTPLPEVGKGMVNRYGIKDLFGVIWEWTSDFNAYSFAGLNQRGVQDDVFFCGGGTTQATKSADYSTYMRWAFRSSLKPNYTVRILGFRCARSLTAKE